MSAKTRIEDAAIELFAAQGIDGTGVRSIAEKAGVAEGSLYRHYKSKDELCQKLFERHYERLGHLFEAKAADREGIADKLAAVVAAAYELFDADRALFTFILLTQHDHLPGLDAVATTPVDAVRTMIRTAVESGELDNVDPDELTAMLFGIALQPAIFTIYGRLQGPLRRRAPRVGQACAHILPLRHRQGDRP